MNEPESGWIHWDDGVNYTATGASTGLFYIAARWDEFMLQEFDGYRIVKIKAFLYDTGYDSLSFNIWSGNNADSVIYGVEYDTIIGGAWIEHELETTIILNASLEFWVGYVAHHIETYFPFGLDSGPAKAGYGDKISYDGKSWDNLSAYGLDYNFNIQFFVEDSTGNEVPVSRASAQLEDRNISLSGYNLYQSIEGGEYALLDFIPYEPDDTSYAVPFIADPNEHCYKLTAVWESDIDTCESVPAKAKDNPGQDYVCVLLVNSPEYEFGEMDWVKCYPNPFSTSTNFEYHFDEPSLVTIQIFNHLGEKVEKISQTQKQGKQQVTWSAEGLPAGIYYFTLRAGNKVTNGKLMLLK